MTSQYKAYLRVFRDFRATSKGVIAEYPATSKLYPWRKSWMCGYAVIPFMRFSIFNNIFKNDKINSHTVCFLCCLKCISKWIRGYVVTTRNNQRLRRVGSNDRGAKRFCSSAVLCVSFTWQLVKTARVIKIRVIEGPNVHDQIAFCAFHSVSEYLRIHLFLWQGILQLSHE